MNKAIFGVLILFFMAMTGYCQESKQPLQHFEKNSPLVLTIKSDKQAYQTGEDIKLRTILTNNSGKEQMVLWSDESPKMGAIIEGVKTFEILNLLVPRTTEKAQPLYIKPKTSIKKDIIFKMDDFIGTANVTLQYEFKGRSRLLHSPEQEICTGPITSNTITIEVTETISDPIERLVEKLAKTYDWINGSFANLELPSTASTEQVVLKVFQMTSFNKGRVARYKILQVKEVQIPGSYQDRYSAVLVDTNLGEKIILLKYDSEALGWWSRVYDKDGSE